MDAKEVIEALAHLREIVECESYPACCSKPLRLAIAALEREHAERWRSVEEEAPEPFGYYIVTVSESPFGASRVFEAYLGGERLWIAGEDESVIATVTHWRPLPAPAAQP